MTRNRVLFVDDEPSVLDGLRRGLWPWRGQWEMRFAGSALEALSILDANPVDVVVADMRMPGRDGAWLLDTMRTEHPEVIRIILSGHMEQAAVLRTVRSAHQFLSKPCSPETLAKTLGRIVRLKSIVGDERCRAVVSRLDSLPVLPANLSEVMRELDKPEPSMAVIGEHIARDPALTATVLKLVNSAFFGFCRQIASPLQAVSLLGTEVLKVVLLTANLVAAIRIDCFPGFTPEHFWIHCGNVSRLARVIAGVEGLCAEDVDLCALAGMLHDLGKLVMAGRMPAEFKTVTEAARAQGVSFHGAERQVLAAGHAEIGAFLLGLWGLGEGAVLAVSQHHEPEAGSGQVVCLAVVHAANALEHELVVRDPRRAPHPLATQWIADQGFGPRLTGWREACRAALAAGAQAAGSERSGSGTGR